MIDIDYRWMGYLPSQEAVQQAITGVPECLAIRENGQRVGNPDNSYFPLYKSSLDTSDKWTEEAERCLVVILSGQTTDSDRISSLLHISPAAFGTGSFHLSDNWNKYAYFQSEYQELLSELRERTLPETRSILIAGSRRSFLSLLEDFSLYTGYEAMVRKITRMNQKMLDLSTTVLRPKHFDGQTDVYFDNSQQKAYIVESTYRRWQNKKPVKPAILSTR